MSWSDVLDASAVEQAALVRSRRVSSLELTRLYLGRVREHNPALQAFVQVLEKSALRSARAKDKEVARGGDLPPFHGVPIGIKDLNLVRCAFARFGSRSFRYFWSPVDDRTTAQLRRGGFVILGKLAASEFGAMPVTEPDTHPPTRNPWSLGHSAGGSSGGSGSAVAAGLLPIAQGSDGGGSIRIPSAFCNLYGLKPSRGRVANAFGKPDRAILYTCGPMARTVGDAAAMLDVMAGVTVGKPHWAKLPPRSFAEASLRDPGRLRIRFTTRNALGPTDAEVALATERAARRLEQLGHEVVEAPAPEGGLDDFLPLWQRLVASMPLRWARLQPVTRWLADQGRRITAAEADALLLKLQARLLEWFGDTDLWLTPTVPCPAPVIGAFAGRPPEQAFREAALLGAFTAPFNITGQPAANVPAGFSAAGLPLGVQLVGKPLEDATVLAVSRQLEEAMPWRGRWAPLVAAERGDSISAHASRATARTA